MIIMIYNMIVVCLTILNIYVNSNTHSAFHFFNIIINHVMLLMLLMKNEYIYKWV